MLLQHCTWDKLHVSSVISYLLLKTVSLEIFTFCYLFASVPFKIFVTAGSRRHSNDKITEIQLSRNAEPDTKPRIIHSDIIFVANECNRIYS